jgi:hypothetical protein
MRQRDQVIANPAIGILIKLSEAARRHLLDLAITPSELARLGLDVRDAPSNGKSDDLDAFLAQHPDRVLN